MTDTTTPRPPLTVRTPVSEHPTVAVYPDVRDPGFVVLEWRVAESVHREVLHRGDLVAALGGGDAPPVLEDREALVRSIQAMFRRVRESDRSISDDALAGYATDAALAWFAARQPAAVRWGVFSYDDGRWYASDPSDRESAERNRDLLRADGETCDVFDETTGHAMQNAVNHARQSTPRVSRAARMPSVEQVAEVLVDQVAEVLAEHNPLWSGGGQAECSCGRFVSRRAMPQHQAERVVALWGAL